MPIIWLKIFKWLGITLAAGLIGWGLYAGLIRPVTKPNPTETQKADIIINRNIISDFHPTFGCMRIRGEKK